MLHEGALSSFTGELIIHWAIERGRASLEEVGNWDHGLEGF